MTDALQRSLSDIQSKISSLDARMTAAASRARPRSLVTRRATAELLARAGNCEPADVAAQRWPRDHQLRAAVAPAQTTVAGWAAELVGTVIEDITGSLLGASAFAQLRALSGASYDLVDGAAVRAPMHQSVASGGFVGEGAPISVGALLIGAVNLQAKKAASITAVTREVLRGSAANVETSLQRLLAEDLSLAVDQVLFDAVAADAIRPAGLRYGVAGLVPSATGSLSEKVAADVSALVAAIMPAKPVVIAAGAQSVSVGALMPGLAVIAAPTLAAGTLICVDADAFANIVGPIDIAASGEPVLHMSDAPLPLVTGAQGAGVVAAPTSSMFQVAAISLRCIQDINWALRRAGSVSWMTGVGW